MRVLQVSAMIRVENEDEQMALDEFRDLVDDLDKDEVTLLRYLRAREYDLKKAEDLIRQTVKWRAENNIESFLDWKPAKVVHQDMTFELNGHDHLGRPIVWIPIGAWNCRQWVQAGYKDDVLQFRYHLMEWATKRISESETADQAVFIFDLKGLTYWKVAHWETMQILVASLQDMVLHYPETMWRLYVINAPSYFSYIFSLIKPVLSGRTTAKLHIFNSDRKKWSAKMLEHMEEYNLPE